jgi:chromate reductase
MRLLGLCGSTRTGSFNRALLAAASQLAPESVTIEPWDLRRLPMYDDDLRLSGFPAEVAAFREAVRAADGLVFATPEYNRSLPTILKNAIDWASRAPDQPFDGKPVAILGAATGLYGTARSQYDLRKILGGLNAMVLNKPEVLIGQAATRFDAEGRLTDETARGLLAQQMAALQAWTLRLKG